MWDCYLYVLCMIQVVNQIKKRHDGSYGYLGFGLGVIENKYYIVDASVLRNEWKRSLYDSVQDIRITTY